MSENVLNNVSLCFWNLENATPTVAQAREALSANNLNPERAEDVPASTAFRRAGRNVFEKDHAAKFWQRKLDNCLTVQIDKVEENGDGRLHREFVSVYALENDLPTYVCGKRLDAFAVAYEDALGQYIGSDVSRIIQDVLTKDGLGAYSPRKGGAVYFVPVLPDTPDLLARIEGFSAAVGVRFLKYAIPDVVAQREEIGLAIGDSLVGDLGEHAAAIAKYTNETKLGHLVNRREFITHTETMIGKLRHLLVGRAAIFLVEEISRLRKAVDAKQAEIEAHQAEVENQVRQANPVGRRIVKVVAHGG